MKKQIIFISGLLAVLMTACSPKVVTDIAVSYPAIPVDSVEVFEEDDYVVATGEYLGTVAVYDRGMTSKCKYDYVVQLAKERTAAIGGNALQLTRHLTPSFQSTCHQIQANMLRLSEFDINAPLLEVPDADSLRRFPSERFAAGVSNWQLDTLPEHQPFRDAFIIGAGPMWNRSKIETGNGTYENKSGYSIAATYRHLWLKGRSGLGFGLHGQYTNTSFGGYTRTARMETFFIGPTLEMSYLTTQFWSWDLGYGLGYTRYSETGTTTENAFGSLMHVGAGKKFSRNLIFGIDYSFYTHRFKKPAGVQLAKNEFYGLQTSNIALRLLINIYDK